MLKAGGKFGEFEVVRELGRGGMGAVYLVREPATGAEYAAKMMFPELAVRDGSYLKRFVREAEIAMAANHPNLVKVHDAGIDPETGYAYMIMDYAGGGTLHERMTRRLIEKRGPYSVREAMGVIRPLLSALGEAERLQVVHRDIKPDNILFDSSGAPKLADLGIAKVSDAQATTLVTMSNVVVGTPAYMAPEQLLNSHRVDARADLYSLGVVLYELLAGERPNADLDSSQLMARAVKGQRIPDIRTFRKNLPPRILEFIRRLTDPKPEKRFPSAASALRFLNEWQKRQEIVFRRFLVGFGALLAAILVAIVTVGIRWIRAPEVASMEGAKAPAGEESEFSVPESAE